jgi:DNA invertase Pin-like site-specific DNA recombinase
MTKPAVIYAAKSTKDEHDSILGQIRDCRALADGEGLEVVGVFQEEDASGFHGDRGPDLERAMRACEEAAPCALVVQHTSRLARGNVRESRHLVQIAIWAIQHDVELRSVENPLPADNLLLLAAVAGDQDHAYSKRLGTSVSGGLARSFARGNWPGKVADGYRVEVERDSAGRTTSRQLVIDPDMEPAIGRIFELGRRRLPPAAIMRDLNSAGVTNGRGSQWRARDVKRVLIGPVYAGILQFMGEERRAGCPAYVSEEDHEGLVAHYGGVRPRAQGPARKGRRSSYLLRGLLVCSCGKPMDARTRTEYGQRQYRCRSYQFGESCRAWVRADDVDERVLQWLDTLLNYMEGWRRQVHSSAAREREGAGRELAAALAAVDKCDRRAAALERQNLKAIDAGLDGAAESILSQMERNARERGEAVRTAAERQAAVDALSDEEVDAEMRRTIERLSVRDAVAINDGLHAEFERFVFDPERREVTGYWRPKDLSRPYAVTLRCTSPC